MPTAFLEIVELSDGRIILRRAEDGGALITLEFSADAKAFMQGQHLEIAKTMLTMGIELANDLEGIEPADESDAEELVDILAEATGTRVLH